MTKKLKQTKTPGICRRCGLTKYVNSNYHNCGPDRHLTAEGFEDYLRNGNQINDEGTMSESIKAAREKAWKDFVGDNSGNIYQPISFNAGFDAAQKVADEQTADLRNRLEAYEALINAADEIQFYGVSFGRGLKNGKWKRDDEGRQFPNEPEYDSILDPFKELQEATKDGK